MEKTEYQLLRDEVVEWYGVCGDFQRSWDETMMAHPEVKNTWGKRLNSLKGNALQACRRNKIQGVVMAESSHTSDEAKLWEDDKAFLRRCCDVGICPNPKRAAHPMHRRSKTIVKMMGDLAVEGYGFTENADGTFTVTPPPPQPPQPELDWSQLQVFVAEPQPAPNGNNANLSAASVDDLIAEIQKRMASSAA